ncbi:MAG: hypothetical protein Q8R11_02100 [bacterium]|nr:hypothetical protein [bacterium]
MRRRSAEQEPNWRDDHYSNRGGHVARSEFWQRLRDLFPQDVYPPKISLEEVVRIRRQMFRSPRDGR